MSCSLQQRRAALATGVVYGAFVDHHVPELVPNPFAFERLECMLNVVQVALMYPGPINELDATIATTSSLLLLDHFLGMLETVEPFVALGVAALDLQRLYFGVIFECHNATPRQ
jgi:hypothetical protein